MKRYSFTLMAIIVFSVSLYGQRSYITGDSEMIFSVADITKGGVGMDSHLRWTTFYHSATYHNYDVCSNFGFYYGLALRNVGFITRDESIGGTLYNMVKRRSYSLGLPVGIKLGDINRNTFIFGGVEYEWMFHYKEKRFVDGVKVYKEKDMFSRQTNRFIPSVYAGINFRSDLAVTFKLYLDDLMNRSYTEPVSGIRPYQNMESQLFYISLSKKFKYSRIKEIATPRSVSL